MKIVIFGAGYIGTVASVCYAEMGCSVGITDIDKYKLAFHILNLSKDNIKSIKV